MIEAFHFLRPLWLLALLPVALLGWRLWRRGDSASGWQGLIQPELLVHLLEPGPGNTRRHARLALMIAWLLAVLALAGPTWEQLPQPVYRGQQAQVLMLDLSPSMLAADLKPSRMVHARHRLIDLIKAQQEGVTGLVVYSGDAHVVTPLSHDRRTLLALAPTLSPDIMPAFGSRVEAAVEQALTLLERGGQRQGDLVLITDGVTPQAQQAIRTRLAGSSHRLSILGVGSAAGAPVPLADGRLARGSDGELLLARLNRDELAALARDTGGLYRDLAADGSGVEALVDFLQRPVTGAGSPATVQVERQFDRWQEAGPWLVLLLLPLAALAHRRGWLLLVLLVPLGMPEPAYAFEWRDLWLTPDQQGAQALARDEPEAAAGLFEDPRRQGQALYRSGDYARAAERFAAAAFPDGDTHYNRGNALARAGKLEEALAAYDQALALDPDLDDARHNRGLVEALLKQQEQESSGGEDGQGEASQDSPQSEKSGGQPDVGQGEGAGSESENQSEDSPGEGSQEQDPGAASPPPQTEEGKTGEGESQRPPDGEGAGSAEPESESADEPQQEGAPGEASPAPQEEPAGAGSPVTQGGGQEQDPVMERWLRQLPEDPGGLLRRKFDYEYQQRRARGAISEQDEPRW